MKKVILILLVTLSALIAFGQDQVPPTTPIQNIHRGKREFKKEKYKEFSRDLKADIRHKKRELRHQRNGIHHEWRNNHHNRHGHKHRKGNKR